MRPLSFLIALAIVALPWRDSRAEIPREPPWSWAPQSASPTAVAAGDLSDSELELQRACGGAENGLRDVAKRIVARKAAGLTYLDQDGLAFAARVAGEPHVWPHAWVVSAQAMDRETTLEKLRAFRQSFQDAGVRRCGVAIGYAADGTQIVAAVALDAIADLATPLPTRARVGAWLTVEARVTVATSAAHVVVVGPGGEPHTVPTSFDGSRVRARFSPDRPGGFTVQVVTEVATGPRPALEARVFADVDPPAVMPDLTAPGEAAAQGVRDDDAALYAMLLSLRATEHLAPLTRDARLDGLALAHARRMLGAKTVAHDVGDGDPSQRLQNASLWARETGENVAHAETVVLAHRALFESPSHRANMVRAEFDRVGVAAVTDEAGTVWVCELFAKDLR